jgi:hypothetical protein
MTQRNEAIYPNDYAEGKSNHRRSMIIKPKPQFLSGFSYRIGVEKS